MLYYFLKRINFDNAYGYKIVRGTIDHEEGNFFVLDTDEGMICIHRSKLHDNYDSAREEARYLLGVTYGEEI